MDSEIVNEIVVERHQVNSDALLSCHFHHRNEVSVSDSQHDCVYDSLDRDRGDIESESEVYSLLFDVRHHIFGDKSSGALPQRPQHAPMETPALESSGTAANSKIVVLFDRGKERRPVSVLWSRREVDSLSVDRVLCFTLVGRRVVKIDAKQVPTVQARNALEFLAERKDVSGSHRAPEAISELLSNEATIERDCVPMLHGKKMPLAT
ncbi:MAG: hypothetical protein WEF99_09715 [Thermoanaerobaculia bacterium]